MILKLGKYLLLRKEYIRFSSSIMSTGGNCGVSLTKVISALENFAPKQLSENWDNTGLLVEPYTPRYMLFQVLWIKSFLGKFKI